MKERPIIFSTPMVRAILDGRKTMTRRVVKPQPDLSGLKPASRDLEFEFRKMPILGPTHKPAEWGFVAKYDKPGAVPIFGYTCPYGQPGDLLWVRETWYQQGRYEESSPVYWHGDKHIAYSADLNEEDLPESRLWNVWRKRPSIYMPKWASRIWLRIADVRVQRLQNITDAEAILEGIDRTNTSIPGFANARFKTLWNSINGKAHPWESDPWVWVVGFEREVPV